jgi:acetoacetyl-CoA synthetase
MGSADIYAVVDRLPGVAASLVIGAELADGGYFMPLFVALAAGTELTPDLIDQIRQDIRARVSPRHVPDEVVAVPAIPMTITGKKMEVPIKRLLQGVPEDRAVNRATLANPEALDWFLAYVRDRRATQGLEAEAARR